MKKFTAVLLTAVLVLALTACAKPAEEPVEAAPTAEPAASITFDLNDTPPTIVTEPIQ